MVTIVKHEYHQVDSQFAVEIDADILAEIYPDLTEDELDELLVQIETGYKDIDELVEEAIDAGVELEWERQYDDWWTDRKGGYEVTYELGDDDSWHSPDTPPEPTHKCTKCRWTGQSYDTLTQHLREDGSVIEDYYTTDEESHSTKDVCPMCDSDLELTPEGVIKEQERKEREARWAEEMEEIDDGDGIIFEDENEPPHAECTSCDWSGPEVDTLTIEGQMCCPECREPVLTAEQVAEQRQADIQAALEELKQEFEKLMEEGDDADDSGK